LIRIPVSLSQRARRAKYHKERIYVEKGNTLESSQYAPKVDLLQQINFDTLSLDEDNYYNEVKRFSDLDYLADNPDPRTLVETERMYERLKELVKSLSQKEAYIINSYFGLNGFTEKNFSQIAKDIGMSRERVRQLQQIALQKLSKRSNYITGDQIYDIYI
jgi:RNA polymerase sigma factor (sigma-70 family)